MEKNKDRVQNQLMTMDQGGHNIWEKIPRVF